MAKKKDILDISQKILSIVEGIESNVSEMLHEVMEIPNFSQRDRDLYKSEIDDLNKKTMQQKEKTMNYKEIIQKS